MPRCADTQPKKNLEQCTHALCMLRSTPTRCACDAPNRPLRQSNQSVDALDWDDLGGHMMVRRLLASGETSSRCC